MGAEPFRLVEAEARRVFGEVVSSPWWSGPFRKKIFRDLGESLEVIVRKWGAEALRRQGYRVVRVLSGSVDRGAITGFFLERGGEYRLFYVEAVDVIDVKGKRGLVTGVRAFYGLLPEKYVKPYDYLLPRLKRQISASGYWMVLWRHASPEAAERFLEGKLVVDDPRYISVRAECYASYTLFEQYKAKYVLFVPPVFIVWKWGHIVYPIARVRVASHDGVCPVGGG